MRGGWLDAVLRRLMAHDFRRRLPGHRPAGWRQRVTRIDFDVLGLPAAQGSMRAFVRGGRAYVTHDAKGDLMAWRNAIATEARAALHDAAALGGAVKVNVTFHLPRPKGHFGVRGLLPAAPAEPTTKPDIDRLVRAALDAMTGVLFVDDAQVVELHVRKCYLASPTGVPGAEISVSEVVA